MLEQPACGIVIFADVDLTPQEVTADFAHEPLPRQQHLGTVGLWLQNCTARRFCRRTAPSGVPIRLRDRPRAASRPRHPDDDAFHGFSLSQASLHRGEIWEVNPARIELALEEGVITAEQAEQFRQAGVIGSHLEILERNDGYKGFNQTGITEIIHKTDPRKQ